jgi:predicted metal-dependent hydrolase
MSNDEKVARRVSSRGIPFTVVMKKPPKPRRIQVDVTHRTTDVTVPYYVTEKDISMKETVKQLGKENQESSLETS